MNNDAETPYTIISTDSHTGPDLTVLREYCDQRLLGPFDEYVEASTNQLRSTESGLDGAKTDEDDDLARSQAEDVGVNDPAARLANMDADGIAAEVIFHGSGIHRHQRGLIPFSPALSLMTSKQSWDVELQAEGKRIFNRWLVDFCSVAPTRLLGVAEVPYWDIDSAVSAARSAGEAGFRCINFAGARPGMIPYSDRAWDPFWSTVEDYDLTLNCHSGSGTMHDFAGSGAAFRALFWSETHFIGHLPLPLMVFGGVFERHPKLRVVFNEQRGYWVAQMLEDLDAMYANPWNAPLRAELPEPPSQYWRSNCFLGGSFLARFELESRSQVGVETITWGRDYPHVEGTWPHTSAALRAAFSDLPEDEVRVILGDSGLRAYALDPHELEAIGRRVGPLPSEVSEPLEHLPEGAQSWAFRDRHDALGGARRGAY